MFLWIRPIKLQYNRLILTFSSVLIISIIKEFTRVCLSVFMGVYRGNTEIFFSMRDFLNFTFSSRQFHSLLCSEFSDLLLEPTPANTISKSYSEDFIKMQITGSICLLVKSKMFFFIITLSSVTFFFLFGDFDTRPLIIIWGVFYSAWSFDPEHLYFF